MIGQPPFNCKPDPGTMTRMYPSLDQKSWIYYFRTSYNKPDGSTGIWDFVSRNAEPQPGRPLKANAVLIVPILKNKGKKRKLIVTKEFRHPIGDWEYGFPAGLIDGDESCESAAARELFQETGLTVTKVLAVTPPMTISAGLTDEAISCVFVECEGKPSDEHLEPGEQIEVEALNYKQICQLRRRSDIKMSVKLWPVLLMFEGFGKIKFPRKLFK